MSTPQVSKWERTRTKGRLRFVLTRSLVGVVLWLGFCGLAHFDFRSPLSAPFLMFTFAFFAGGSILSACVQWILSEWIYSRSTTKLPWQP
jgi:hypothetical protein